MSTAQQTPQTYTERSLCHLHSGEWTPEPYSPAWWREQVRVEAFHLTTTQSMALADNRPGIVPEGRHPIHREPLQPAVAPKYLHSRAKIHLKGSRCGHALHSYTYPLHVVEEYAFEKVARDTPEKCCVRCLMNYNAQ